jgi:AhpD family alkylhydroperoxidase
MALPAFDVPAAMDARTALEKAGTTGLAPGTRELVHIRPSQINGCGVCSVAHPRIARKQGRSEEKIWAVGSWRPPRLHREPRRSRRRMGSRSSPTASSPTAHLRWATPPPGGVKPYNYLPWSIISIFLFWPTGIPAIINATKVDPAWQMGNAPMAQEHSNKAKKFSMIGTIIGAVCFVIWVIISLV